MATLGVDISSSKTHTSRDMYEFAKRWIRNGVEITGIPLHGVVGVSKYYLVAHWLQTVCSKYLETTVMVANPCLASLITAMRLPIRVSKLRDLLVMPVRVDKTQQVNEDSLRLFLECY